MKQYILLDSKHVQVAFTGRWRILKYRASYNLEVEIRYSGILEWVRDYKIWYVEEPIIYTNNCNNNYTRKSIKT